MALARSEQQAEQKTLPACEGCGLEPEQAPVNSQAIGQFYWCPFCQDNLPGEFSRDAWTTRQFRRRHEAIDRLTIAIVQGTSIAPVLIGGIGALMGTRQPDSAAEAAVRKSYEAAPKVAAEIHKINLAQRRAEALKIMEGRGCC